MTRLAKAFGLMSRSSRNLYMLVRKRNFCSSVCMSDARPVRPTMILSLIWKSFFISVPIVWFLMPKRLSEAMATQFLPVIAMTAAPLYCMMDDMADPRLCCCSHASLAGWAREVCCAVTADRSQGGKESPPDDLQHPPQAEMSTKTIEQCFTRLFH